MRQPRINVNREGAEEIWSQLIFLRDPVKLANKTMLLVFCKHA
jgi:hypothetical protein